MVNSRSAKKFEEVNAKNGELKLKAATLGFNPNDCHKKKHKKSC